MKNETLLLPPAQKGLIKVLKRPSVEKMAGVSRSKIYAMMSHESPYYDPDWPKPVRLGARSVGWLEHEVIAWIESRPVFASQHNGGVDHG